MAADSVGQIGLDLVVNKNDFDKQMKGIQGLAKKAGAALAAAFAVKKLIDFGAQCIELGSDLQEVQNVVDVTFPRMSKSSTCLDIRGNVTSTTFWTSARSEPNLIHCAPKSMIFFTANAAARAAPAFLASPWMPAICCLN
mgnify:CR=1 FL=1